MAQLPARQHLEEAGLAGPIGTGKTNNLSLLDVERYSLKDRSPTELERDVGAGQQSHR